jgi:hypothetical protein
VSPKSKKPSSTLEEQLSELENLATEKGIQIHYDRLEAAGLKLKGGICKVDGTYHIFVDSRKSTGEKVDALRESIERQADDSGGDAQE